MSSRDDSRRQRTPGAMAFTELASTNLSKTRKFLEETFGWKFDSVQMPTGQYLTFQNPAGTTVGIRSAQEAEIPGSTNYVLVKRGTFERRAAISFFLEPTSLAWAASSGSRSPRDR